MHIHKSLHRIIAVFLFLLHTRFMAKSSPPQPSCAAAQLLKSVGRGQEVVAYLRCFCCFPRVANKVITDGLTQRLFLDFSWLQSHCKSLFDHLSEVHLHIELKLMVRKTMPHGCYKDTCWLLGEPAVSHQAENSGLTLLVKHQQPVPEEPEIGQDLHHMLQF